MKSALTKAAKELRAVGERAKIKRITEKVQTNEMVFSGSAVAGAAGAAVIDRKWGEGDDAAKVKGVPVNLGIGLAGIGAALALPKAPGRNVFGGAALGMLCASAYKLTHENVDV